ncbi:MAG: alanine racemase [Pseudoxanthomonas suwonensis]|nr:alanine racemase [Pseudoxanthomonas suwonensis]
MATEPAGMPGRRRFLAGAAGLAAVAGLPACVTGTGAAGAAFGRATPAAANAWIEVDPAVLDRNLGRIRTMLAGGTRLCAVMKADAYGCGIDLVMENIIRAGITDVAIATNEEAESARRHGYRGRLLRVRPATPEELADAVALDVEELVGDLDAARLVARIAGRRKPVPVHLALDAGGMSRNGLDLGSVHGRREAQALVATPGLRLVGLMTHFPMEERADCLGMLEVFRSQADWLFANTALRRQDVLLHAANSWATQQLPEAHLDMVRVGGALYGYGSTPKPPFEHAIAFKTRVASVNDYPAGRTVGYDRTHVLRRDALLANLTVGYADGYRRAFSDKGHVLVRGRRAPVVGRVSMNTTMVDVTDIPGVVAGDEVVLFGRQGGDTITQQEIEELTGTILADQYTVWGYANPRRMRR